MKYPCRWILKIVDMIFAWRKKKLNKKTLGNFKTKKWFKFDIKIGLNGYDNDYELLWSLLNYVGLDVYFGGIDFRIPAFNL